MISDFGVAPDRVNMLAAWLGVFAGLLSGVPLGLAFHNDGWLGGYQSWPRRLLRLAHISFFGMAFLNFAFVASVIYLRIPWTDVLWPSRLFVVALITMPVVCAAAAAKKPLRHLFVVPVVSVLLATGLFLWRGFSS